MSNPLDENLLRATLNDLREGKLEPHDIFSALAQFEDADFVEAVPVIEALVEQHPDPIVRAVAMTTIGFYFPERQQIALAKRVLLQDPDEDARQRAAGALGNYAKRFGDASLIPLLLTTNKNEKEHKMVRDAAYSSLLVWRGLPTPSPFDETIFDPDFIHSIESEFEGGQSGL